MLRVNIVVLQLLLNIFNTCPSGLYLNNNNSCCPDNTYYENNKCYITAELVNSKSRGYYDEPNIPQNIDTNNNKSCISSAYPIHDNTVCYKGECNNKNHLLYDHKCFKNCNTGYTPTSDNYDCVKCPKDYIYK